VHAVGCPEDDPQAWPRLVDIGESDRRRHPLTELGYMNDPPTRDFLRWDGVLFDEPKNKTLSDRTGQLPPEVWWHVDERSRPSWRRCSASPTNWLLLEILRELRLLLRLARHSDIVRGGRMSQQLKPCPDCGAPIGERRCDIERCHCGGTKTIALAL
jgi:hypothetical protein